MTKSPPICPYPGKLSADGESAFSRNDFRGWKINLGLGDRPFFPPEVVVSVKALACELPRELELPLSRFSQRDLAREVCRRGIAASISGKTIWRWLHEDAIHPWRFRSWIYPRDPLFEEKAEKVLNLYQGFWQEKPLQDNDFVLSADEKTSIQARIRIHPGETPGPGRYRKVEFEYERGGALAYLAAWDVRRGKVFGRCEKTTGIEPFGRLVQQVMNQKPYDKAQRVFWIADNGSSHRGEAACQRLQKSFPNLILVHLPIHASWLNQIEIYFSVIQRKVLTPNDFPSLQKVERCLMDFEKEYEKIASPFEWKFTASDLKELMSKIHTKPLALAA